MSFPISDAVTAILRHDGHVFMTRRNPVLLAFPGYHTFPGGKVDTDDADGAIPAHRLFAGQDPRLLRALIRELREELDFDLEAGAESGLVTGLHFCGRAVTPAAQPRRFDTRFFVIDLARRPDFIVDAREAVETAWAPPGDWLAGWTRGEIILAPPTLSSLEALASDPLSHEMPNMPLDGSRSWEVDANGEALILNVNSINGLDCFWVRSNTLPPAQHTNCFVTGDAGAPRLGIDPSPRDDGELALIERTLLHYGVNQLLITHHHHDHNERADVLARRHGWPMLMSAATRDLIMENRPRFFDGIELRLIEDGDEVTRWNGQAVRALKVPGHDAGQIALMPDDARWCIVGDLIQGVGTVVIQKPEGNMRRYFASLQRIIDLAPRFIFPSHGIGMGTTHRLEETLHHRQQREQQVLEMKLAGRSDDEMLAEIYRGIDSRLLPLARKNIESHLDKLVEEGRLQAAS